MDSDNSKKDTRSSIAEGDHTKKQQENPREKKKKCRGNPKRQRYRRQLYKQGLDSASVERRIQEKFPKEVQARQQHQATLTESNRHNIKVFIPLDRVGFFFFNDYLDITIFNHCLSFR